MTYYQVVKKYNYMEKCQALGSIPGHLLTPAPCIENERNPKISLFKTKSLVKN
jgi:hypothetical protein